MGDRILKLQQRLSFKPTATPGHEIISTPVVERPSLRVPPEALLPRRGSELQATSAPIRFAEPTRARSGSHDPEKALSERHSQSTHNISYSHSRVTCANPEDDGDEDRPREHAIWVLVGPFYFSLKVLSTDVRGFNRSTCLPCHLFSPYQQHCAPCSLALYFCCCFHCASA